MERHADTTSEAGERRRAERALREREARLRAVLTGVPTVLWALDRDGVFTFSEGRDLEALGLKPGEVVGRSVFDVYRDVPRVLEDTRRALAGEEFTSVVELGGLTLEARYSALRDEDGAVVGVVGAASDVTRQRQVVEELRRSESALRARAEQSERFQVALLELARAGGEELEATLRRVTRAGAEALEVERASAWFFAAGETELECRVLYVRGEDAHRSGTTLRSADLPDYFATLRERRVIAADDAVSDPATHEFADGYLVPLGITSMLDVPIWRGGRMVGVVCHEHVGEPREWTIDEQEFAGSLADMVSLALEADDRKRAQREAERMAERMGAVAAAAAGVICAASRPELRRVLEEACRKVVPFDAFFVSAYDPEAHAFHGFGGSDAGVYSPEELIPAAGTPGERVVRERRSVVTGRADDPASLGAELTGTGRRSESVIRTPILRGPRALGILSVQSYTPDLYTAGDVEVVEALASLAATALENIRLAEARRAAEEAMRRAREEAQRMAERMAAVAAAAAGVVGAPSVEALHEVLREACRRVVSFDAFTFAFYDEAAHAFTYAPGYDADVLVPAETVPAAGTPSERVVRERRSLVTVRADDPAGQGTALMGTGRRSESVVRSPIVGGEGVLGVLAVHSYTPGRYGAQDVEVLEAVAALAANALENVRLLAERREAVLALQRAHDELEDRVEARTAELAETNLAMEEEISERVRAEQELLDKQSELEAVFRALPDHYFRLALDGTVLDFQAGQTSPLSIPSPDVVGQRLCDLLPPGPGALVAEAMREVARTRELVCVEYAVPSSEGEKHFEARLLPLLDAGVVTIVRDVTDRVRSERELQRSEEHFRSLIENASDVITILDAEGNVVYESPSIERVAGYTPEELVGRSGFELIHPDDVGTVLEAFGEVVASPGTARKVEFRYRHRDGSWITLEAVGTARAAASGSEGVVVNLRDVTERRLAEAALQLAKEEAERAREAAETANRAKSEFLSRMSHELRTPMNSILGFAQILARKELPADQRKAVDHVLRAGRHLLNLINEVLDIARIESGRQPLSLEPVRLGAVLREAVSMVRPLADARGVWVRDAAGAAADTWVHADR
ncbi:MAG TPA: PAS domain S-box protein, partial [Longimicrobiaceae bacterium]